MKRKGHGYYLRFGPFRNKIVQELFCFPPLMLFFIHSSDFCVCSF